MAIDGITIRALVNEIKEKIIGGHIQKIYQVKDHLIILHIYNNKETHKLLISSNPQNTRIHFTESSYDYPAKPPQFAMILRKHLQNAKINNIIQVGLDRTIVIKVKGKDELGFSQDKKLIIDIMGKHSNIVLTYDNNIVIEAIKRISHEMSSVRAVYPGKEFIPLEDDKYDITNGIKDLDTFDIDNNYKIKKVFYMTFTGFGPQIGQEIAYRSDIDTSRNYGSLSEEERTKLNNNFKLISQEVLSNHFIPHLYKEDNLILDFYPLELKHMGNNFENPASMSQALDIYYSQNVDDNSLNQARANLKQILTSRLKKANNKLDNLIRDFEKSEKHEDFRIKGDLLTSVAHNIEKGQNQVEVFNYYTNENISIELNEKKNAWDNINDLYKTSKKLQRRNKILNDSIPKLKDDIAYLENIIRQLDMIDSLEDLEEIKDELKSQGIIKKQKTKNNKKAKEESKYLQFLTENNNTIYVGKNNKQNEEITLRLANQEDLFFHIKDFPGSHVILKKGQELEDYEIQVGAYLAALYSKNSNDRYIDVDYTKKKNVNKAKGSKPGMVYYKDFNTIRVDLENPPSGYKKIE